MLLLVTGAAGFLGSHVAAALLERGDSVIGVDNLNVYYDPALKAARLDRLESRPGFTFHKVDISEAEAVYDLVRANPQITAVIHLAAQAGVRYSLEHPFAYIDANIRGQQVMIEACRRLPALEHFVYASSSSVYGANRKLPFSVTDRVDRPVSLYAATKRSGELLAETAAHLHRLPSTGLRFFTVYGPWGRPDMSAYIFAKAIFEGQPITIFNDGKMKRDFTYIDDVVAGVLAAAGRPPSDAATPHRLYNLGNHRAEDLMRFIAVLEAACGREAVKTFAPMQPGDVAETFADIAESRRDLGFEPRTGIDEGLPHFVGWFREYHGI